MVSEGVKAAIKRCREKQKTWGQQMKKDGWKGCPICKSIPIAKGEKMCARCECKRSKNFGNHRRT